MLFVQVFIIVQLVIGRYVNSFLHKHIVARDVYSK